MLSAFSLYAVRLIGFILAHFIFTPRPLQHDDRRCRMFGMGETEMNLDVREPRGQARAQYRQGPAIAVVEHGKIFPRKVAIYAGAERFGKRFFGGEPRGKRGGALGAAFTQCNFFRRKNALRKALRPARQHFLNAGDFYEIDAEATNHGIFA